jgi:hypothetical protein
MNQRTPKVAEPICVDFNDRLSMKSSHNLIHTDNKKRRSFVALLFVDGEVKR